MLQIVLSMITGAVLALGIAWFVRKYKGQIQKIISKYLYWILGICFPLLTGLLIGALIHSKGEELGSWADWVSGIATVLALLFAYAEIRNSREQFEKEHKPKLMVYIGWKNNYSGVRLHIVPVNKGWATGIYRYLGICREKDLNEIICLVNKARDNNINCVEVDKLANFICFDSIDIGQDAQYDDGTGMSLLCPNDNKLFQTIDSNSVGKIIDKERWEIEKYLHVDISRDVLEVLYIDPNMRIYSFKVKKFEHSKDMPDIRISAKK